MIITKQKDFKEILEKIGRDSVFIIGCSECATICHTGGEEEVKKMKTDLGRNKIVVTDFVILDPACHLNNSKRLLKPYKDAIEKSKKILVLSCGNGVQTISELLDNKEIISGTDTQFLGEIKRLNEFERRCTMCGECLLNTFAGLCPVTRCPKSMLNGPCGGSKNGKCEISKDLECIWEAIYKKLKEKNELEKLCIIQKPKDWSKSLEVRRKI